MALTDIPVHIFRNSVQKTGLPPLVVASSSEYKEFIIEMLFPDSSNIPTSCLLCKIHTCNMVEHEVVRSFCVTSSDLQINKQKCLELRLLV